jgi:hypothetical protein
MRGCGALRRHESLVAQSRHRVDPGGSPRRDHGCIECHEEEQQWNLNISAQVCGTHLEQEIPDERMQASEPATPATTISRAEERTLPKDEAQDAAARGSKRQADPDLPRPLRDINADGCSNKAIPLKTTSMVMLSRGCSSLLRGAK